MDEPERISAKRIAWFCLLAAIGCGLDLLTKHLVFSSPRFFHGDEWWLWEGHVGIQKSLNEGALFGMGQGNVWLFASFSVIAMIAIPVWLFWYRAAEDFALTTALGLVMGGVVGNFYDRVGLHEMTWNDFHPQRGGERVYAVRDWILFQVNDKWVWPNFNIADTLLVIGAIFLVAYSLLMPSDQQSH